MQSVEKRRRGATVVAGLVCALLVVAGLPADAAPGSPGPSADEVARASAEAREQDRRLGAATALLAEAEAELEGLTARAEKLIEAYNGELVRLAQAEERQRRADEQVRAAGAQVEDSRRAVAALAAQSYGGMDPMMGLMADVGGGGADAGYLQRMSVMAHVGGGQAARLRELRDAREVLVVFQEQAAEAYAERRAAAERADAAKSAAERAVAEQVAQTRRLAVERAVLERRADAARSTADRLARERAEALERARIARERAAQERARRAALRRERARNGVRNGDGGGGGGDGSGWASGPGSSARGDIAADWALTQLGKPYVWAADGPGSYDCSGLTMRAWERVGVRLDHWTGTQWTSGPHVPLDRLRRGDLVFFGRITRNPGDIHHVGMYIGGGMMVHAPRTGDVVRIAPIWRSDLVGATRPT
ncbi:cell wall-associated hydrolase (invasion-associated protein)-like protein [Planomonospora sphaerica]|uniref:Cell wall-associated hydrolase (Invasion-associated protein)-like protein n=1 Tax=Planomonospora sphaerica TaxID=161355 RepID=A0A171DMS1_9ACTN|nr:C40 family peptidase [Planomonospora sphaerica]GAT70319.1 cell wall-associated hydrolase (invasion-associated protein)-like protein [Planomonospora sphaerica]